MTRRIVQTIIPNDGVFHVTATARREGKGRSMRIAVPAAAVRGLIHLGWAGRWLHVVVGDAAFKAAVRPHPTSVMFALPKSICRAVKSGDRLQISISQATGPAAPRRRRVRGAWKASTPTLGLSWLGG